MNPEPKGLDCGTCHGDTVMVINAFYDARFDDWREEESQRLLVCNEKLREFVDIPDGIARITIETYKRPGPGRIKVSAPGLDQGRYCRVSFNDVELSVYNLLYELVCELETCYVSVSY